MPPPPPHSHSPRACVVVIYMDMWMAAAQNGPEATYDIREVLGTGAFATVKTAVHKKTGTKYAVKIIEKKKFILNHGTTRANALMV